MNNAFDDREKGFETQLKVSQDLEFRIAARRNKLLGEWLGEKLGLNQSEIPKFANTIVIADLEEPGEEDVIRACIKAIQERHSELTVEDIREKIVELDKVALNQLKTD